MEKRIEKILIRNREKDYVLPVSDIVALEGDGAYTILYFKDGTSLRQSRNMKHSMKQLGQHDFFIASHRSWIVNLNYMVGIDNKLMEVLMETGVKAKLTAANRRLIKERFQRTSND